MGGAGYLGNIIYVSSGDNESAAISSDGTIYTWGYNNVGQLGNNTTTYSKVPTVVLYKEIENFNTGSASESMIAGGIYAFYAKKSDGTVYAWGRGTNGGLGEGSNNPRHLPIPVHGLNNVGELSNIKKVVSSGAGSFALALTNDGNVYSWGANGSGQLGNNTTSISYYPIQVLGVGGSGYLTDIIDIGIGQEASYAVKSDGTVYAWGKNDYGQLGNNSTTNSSIPVQILDVSGTGFLSGITKIASNFRTAYALASDGTVYSWGRNNSGQLGNNTTINSSLPVKVLGPGGIGYLSNITQILSGGSVGDTTAAYAIKSDGTVWSWGNGWNGVLGDGTTVAKKTPVQVLGPGGVGYLSGITKMSADKVAMALKSDGTVYAWGKNDYGQMGQGNTTDSSVPLQVKGIGGSGYLSNVVDIASSSNSSLALKSDGTVYAWGSNYYGQLGNNNSDDQYYPKNVLNLSSTVTNFSAGSSGPVEYYSSGDYTSSVIDLSHKVNFGNLSYDATLNNQTVSVSLRAGNIAIPDETWTNWATVSNGNSLSVYNGNRYIQYKINLSTSDTIVTPLVNSISFEYSYYATSGDLTSSIYDTNNNTNALKSVSISTSGTSIENTVKLQIRSSPDGNTWSAWCGYNDCSGSSYFTSSENNLSLVSNHPLILNDNDRYLQYKIFLSSNYTSTPSVSSVSLQYFFNFPPSVTNVSAYQISGAESEDIGKVYISYDVKDQDGSLGSTHPGKILPSFEYSVDEGNNWTPVSTNYLRESDIILKDVSNNSFTSYSAVWDTQKQIPHFDSNAMIRVKVDDEELKNSSSLASSASFHIDNMFPQEDTTVFFDAGVAGRADSSTIHIPLPSDSSSGIEYMIYDDEFTESNVKNSGWVSLLGDTVIPWTFDGDIETKYLKYKFRDAFHNESFENLVYTHVPVPSSSFMVQDTSNISANPPYYDVYIGWQATNSSGFHSYKLEQATSYDNITYSDYQDISNPSLLDVTTNYYIARNLDPDLYYKYRLAVIDTNGNTSVRSNSSITTKPDGVQNFGEGGGGSVSTASKIENVIATDDVDKNITVNFKITDSSIYKKVNPLYEAYLFYNNGITVASNPLSGSTLKLSDASKLKNSGYIQINNEVIKYTGKSGNILTGIVRGTWPSVNSSGRATRTNLSFFEGTPVWILANNTNPIIITDNTIYAGQDESISWNTYGETGLAGYSYPNLGIRVLVHDNQDALSGPISTQNDYSEDGVITMLDLTPPSISFESTESTIEENIGTTILNLNLSRAYPFNSSVNYSLSGTTTLNQDYSLSSGTLTFEAGNTSNYLSIPITDDLIKEDNETIIISLSDPVNATLGINSTYTYTISDNDSYSNVGFSLSNVSNNENVTSVKVPILLSEAQGVDVTISYTVAGTATSESDYVLTSGTITIPSGEVEANIDLAIVDDTLKEESETILITLTEVTGASLNTDTTYTYTIVDNDTYPTLSFGSLTSQGKEDVNTANILVNLSSAYPEDVTFKYIVTGGSATGGGIDYLLEDSTGTIPSGSTNTNIPIVIFDDDLSEETENIFITLSDPTNAVLGQDTVHAFSILDNEIMITDINGANVKSTSARIVWTTADYTDSLIEYGTIQDGQEGAYSISKQSVDKVLNHNVYIDGLTPETTYYFKTTSVNLAGETTVSRSQFTTTPGPIISNVYDNNPTDTGVIITWTTDIPSTSSVTYSINKDLTLSQVEGSQELVTDHSVTISSLNPNEIYYYLVSSTDDNSNIGEDANGGSYYNFETGADQTAPSIFGVSTPIRTSSQVAVVWTTDEPADGVIKYGTSQGEYNNSSEHIYTLTTSHLVTVNELKESTRYYYVIESSDENGNSTISEEYSFDTTATERVIINGGGVRGVAQELYDLILAENEAYKARYSSLTDGDPVVSNIEISNITAFGATISFQTNMDTIAFIKYGKGDEYNQTSADDGWSQSHSIKLTGLSLGTEYSFKINAMNKANAVGSSDKQSFTTQFLTENIAELKKIDNVEQFQAEIESTIESILPSLVPPFIDKPVVSDITENSATISFRTNVRAYPVVSYASSGSYDNSKQNPYDGEMSDTSEKRTSHVMTLIGLKSNTEYHVKAKAFSLPQVVGESEDFTFTTKASKIRGSIIDVKKDSFTVVWTTDEPTSSIIEYKNLSTGRISRIVDDTRNNSHSVKIDNLTSGTTYEVNISGINNKNNLIEGGETISIKTSVDNIPPAISNLKVESALIVGRTDKVQTIVSWQTDEPSTSTVYYEEGSGSASGSLANKQEDLELTKNHVVILTTLKPGTVYRFTVESTDGANNISKPPIRTIITPKKTESIVDVIFKNFNETFNFVNNVR